MMRNLGAQRVVDVQIADHEAALRVVEATVRGIAAFLLDQRNRLVEQGPRLLGAGAWNVIADADDVVAAAAEQAGLVLQLVVAVQLFFVEGTSYLELVD